jgi:starch synthase
MRGDILDAYPAVEPERVHVIHNGIDTDFYAPDPATDVLEGLGVDLDRPYVTFVGRITRQKGVPHLLRAGLRLDPSVQLVLLAGAADTPELAAETDAAVAELKARRDGVFVISEMLPREDVRQVLTHAVLFCCPSVYEPLGIVNLEAMACETAVVATATGGIPEVVVDGQTGLLVPIEQAAPGEGDGTGVPLDPDRYVADFAAALNSVVGDPERARAMGRAGRQRAIEAFSWSAIAERTRDIYAALT